MPWQMVDQRTESTATLWDLSTAQDCPESRAETPRLRFAARLLGRRLRRSFQIRFRRASPSSPGTTASMIRVFPIRFPAQAPLDRTAWTQPAQTESQTPRRPAQSRSSAGSKQLGKVRRSSGEFEPTGSCSKSARRHFDNDHHKRSRRSASGASPPRSCCALRSPSSSATVFDVWLLTPAAVAIRPSMPLAPR